MPILTDLSLQRSLKLFHKVGESGIEWEKVGNLG